MMEETKASLKAGEQSFLEPAKKIVKEPIKPDMLAVKEKFGSLTGPTTGEVIDGAATLFAAGAVLTASAFLF